MDPFTTATIVGFLLFLASPLGKELIDSASARKYDTLRSLSNQSLKEKTMQLKPSQVDFLRQLIKREITDLSDNIASTNSAIAHWWSLCDKDFAAVPSVKYAFKQLKIVQNDKRKLQSDLRKMELLQRDLRQLQRGK